MQTPILFLSDAPELPTGLARIGRDLATLLSREPEFRVGYLGLSGYGSRQLPFAQYHIRSLVGHEGQWGETTIEFAWDDFSANEYGVVFTIWDATRLHWFAQPQYLPEPAPMRKFLMERHFQRWGYFPFDATGPGDRLSALSTDTLRGYDRVLCYTQFAKGLVERSIGADGARARDLDWMPHGLNLDSFQPREKREARKRCGFHANEFIVGVVATNQARKDWGLMAQVGALLRQRIPRLRLWWHTDVAERHWSFPALLTDYGLGDITVFTTTTLKDTEMSYFYSSCDVTLHPGLGEGFCYPIAESLACGVPAIHGNYAGGPELVPWGECLVEPVMVRLDTLHNCFRPVFDPKDWVEVVMRCDVQPEACRAAIEHLDWKKLWPSVWRKWFLGGVA